MEQQITRSAEVSAVIRMSGSSDLLRTSRDFDSGSCGVGVRGCKVWGVYLEQIPYREDESFQIHIPQPVNARRGSISRSIISRRGGFE